jgi:hypothetical protein
LLIEIADRIESYPKNARAESIKTAAAHGATDTIADLLQDNLLAIDISTLIPDMRQMADTINCALESSVRSYLDVNPQPQAA